MHGGVDRDHYKDLLFYSPVALESLWSEAFVYWLGTKQHAAVMSVEALLFRFLKPGVPL